MEAEPNKQLFQSNTLIGKQENRKLAQLIQNLLDSSQSHEFRNPVDWKALGLLDYLIVVKKPMDLNQVKKNLNSNQYQSVESCLLDIQLIWDNCRLYNNPQNWVYKVAVKLQTMFKKMIKNYLPFVWIESSGTQRKNKKEPIPKKVTQKIPQPEPKDYTEIRVPAEEQPVIPPEDPTLKNKKQFLYYLPLCSPERIGIIFLLLHKNNPQAIVYAQDGSVHINVEHIDDSMINRLLEQLDMWGIGYGSTLPTKKK